MRRAREEFRAALREEVQAALREGLRAALEELERLRDVGAAAARDEESSLQ